MSGGKPVWGSGAHVRARLLALSRAEPGELQAALLGFTAFFSLLAAYYVLRPLRDEMGIQQGAANLPTLFSAVFAAMVLLVPVFGWLTRRFERRHLLPWLYGFFILNLLAFNAVLAVAGTQKAWVARTFFVWVSVFNLFAVSLFWSLMADLFRTRQAQRLVGFIAAGGTLGALCGPAITVVLAPWLGASGLTLVSAGLLAVCVGALLPLRSWVNPQGQVGPDAAAAGADPVPGEPPGFDGSVWSGLLDVLRSPYLRGICGFLLLYSVLSTFLYFQQADLLPKSFADSTQRTRLLAGADLLVNGVTLVIQLAAFGPLIQRLGTRALLVAMPLASVLGFAALAMAPVVGVLVAFGVVRRAGEYALSKPARETLFNALPPAQKYRAKNVIDTLVHRTGDTGSAWLVQGLRALGLGSGQMLLGALGLALVWLGVAWRLGGRAQALSRAEAVTADTATPGQKTQAFAARP